MGVAIGIKGIDVACKVSEIILVDDNFVTIIIDMIQLVPLC